MWQHLYYVKGFVIDLLGDTTVNSQQQSDFFNTETDPLTLTQLRVPQWLISLSKTQDLCISFLWLL